MLAVGVAILIGMVSMSLWLVQVNNRYSQETAELRRFRAAVLDVLTTMQDIETGQRDICSRIIAIIWGLMKKPCVICPNASQDFSIF